MARLAMMVPLTVQIFSRSSQSQAQTYIPMMVVEQVRAFSSSQRINTNCGTTIRRYHPYPNNRSNYLPAVGLQHQLLEYNGIVIAAVFLRFPGQFDIGEALEQLAQRQI